MTIARTLYTDEALRGATCVRRRRARAHEGAGGLLADLRAQVTTCRHPGCPWLGNRPRHVLHRSEAAPCNWFQSRGRSIRLRGRIWLGASFVLVFLARA